MGVGNRPAACASCGKRLNYKQWYYRNGKHFCKKRCWVTEQAKVAKDESTKAKDAQPTETATKATVTEPAKEAPAA